MIKEKRIKKTFTKEYILSNKGCFKREQVLELPFIDNKRITLKNLYNGLDLNSFFWFMTRKCNLSREQLVSFAVHCAELVLPIYEKRYPGDSRVKDCIQATKDYQLGKITLVGLREKRSDAAYAADAATAAADAAAYAATATATAYAAYAAYAYAYAAATATAYTAATAADAADAEFKAKVWQYIKGM